MELNQKNLKEVLQKNSSEDFPILSSAFYELFESKKTLHNFQRDLSLTMRELQEKEFSKAVKNEPFVFILTCSKGAYVATTTRGMARGIRFYTKKTGRRLLFNSMIYAFKQHVQKEKIKRITVEETPINENEQYELKLAS